MTEFKEGDRVKFTAEITAEVKGVPYKGGGDTFTLKITGGKIGDRKVMFWDYSTGGTGIYLDAAAVERVDPENWPPRKGDVWEADGDEWFARTNSSEGVFLVPAASGGPIGAYYSRSLPSRKHDFEAFKALNPVLAHRRL